jgi:TolB protein
MQVMSSRMWALASSRPRAALAVAAFVAVAGLPLLGSPPVQAAFPGVNGRIVFTSDRTGNFEIFSMNPDGTDVVQLTHWPEEDREPAWSPDGTKIVFVRVVDGDKEIFTMNADGTDPRNVTNYDTYDDEPVWSADGTKIAWRSNRGDAADVWVMDADGSNPVNLTASEHLDDEPAWSPDGSRIVLRSNRDGDPRSTPSTPTARVPSGSRTTPSSPTTTRPGRPTAAGSPSGPTGRAATTSGS